MGVTQAVLVRFAKSFSRRHRTAPTIKRFRTKFSITNRRFYELFPKGLEEVCEKAGIDVPPRIHMADRANNKRKTNDKTIIPSQSIDQTAESDPQLKPLIEANARTRSDLTNCQREVALMQEHDKLSIQLKNVTKHKDALTMVQDRKA